MAHLHTTQRVDRELEYQILEAEINNHKLHHRCVNFLKKSPGDIVKCVAPTPGMLQVRGNLFADGQSLFHQLEKNVTITCEIKSS